MGHLELNTARELAAQAFTQQRLELSISPTEHCNFRCTYCFEDFAHGRMSERVVQSIERLMHKRIPQLNFFGLHWFGGEPLLARSLVLRLATLARDLCQEHGVTAGPGTMSTNGWYLSSELLASLVRAGVTAYQITLDGDIEGHNRTRKRVNGGATFDVIYNNLLAARALPDPFKIMLRMHLHADNLASQLRLVDRLRADFGDDERFNVHPISVGNFGGATIGDIRIANLGDARAIASRVHTLFREGQKGPLEGSYVCYAAKQNRFLIRADGSLAKCTSAPARPDNHIGRVTDEGDLAIDWQKSLKWSFGFRTRDAKHLACPLHHIDKVHAVPADAIRRAPNRSGGLEAPAGATGAATGT